jgi:hypothetical protein
MSTAAELKDEGNKLFVAKKYEQASRKYSDAIAKDASNAVLYANRAACALNLQKYVCSACSVCFVCSVCSVCTSNQACCVS